MVKHRRFSGVFAPVITPFGENLSPDAGRLITHCRWMLSQGVGLSVFGTNSEANSLSADEKIELMDALVGAGIDPKMMMPGTGCCAITETARLTAHATTDLDAAEFDAAPVLLQRGERRRSIRRICRRHSTSRLRRSKNLSLPYPAGGQRASVYWPHRPASKRIPHNGCGHQRQRGQLA